MRKITEAKKLLNELLVAKQNRNLDEDYFHELFFSSIRGKSVKLSEV